MRTILTLLLACGVVATWIYRCRDRWAADDWRDRDLCGTDWQVAQRREWIEQQQRGRR